jgi:hypothetical protein
MKSQEHWTTDIIHEGVQQLSDFMDYLIKEVPKPLLSRDVTLPKPPRADGEDLWQRMKN